MSTDDEIRMVLNGRDIDILRERFLCALSDMEGGGISISIFPKCMNKWD